MSGGVDSLRTAALLKERGIEVFGIHMQLFPDPRSRGWSNDSIFGDRQHNLKSLADQLEIPLATVDFRDLFRTKVILPFMQAYRDGLTPNPCVICNPTIKFGFLFEEARQRGAAYLATGHYVTLVPPTGASDRFKLYRGKDSGKDQSYFLYGLSQQQLSHALFPLGDQSKEQVLEWAFNQGFPRDLAVESQELCFIHSGTYRQLLAQDSPAAASDGPIVDMEGNCLARHKGIFAYTIGQRRGLGIASSAPYYVVDLDAASNTVRVGREQDLYCSQLPTEKVNWLSISPPQTPLRAQVRIRNQHQPAPAWIIPGQGADQCLVLFDAPQRAVTPGQAAVFYQDALVLGGGTIKRQAAS